MTLTEFLLARIADEEYDAHDGGIGPVSSGCWSTGRVIRECEARRRIVHQLDCTQPPASAADYAVEQELELALMHLAAVYDRHPDYRDEWKP